MYFYSIFNIDVYCTHFMHCLFPIIADTSTLYWQIIVLNYKPGVLEVWLTGRVEIKF